MSSIGFNFSDIYRYIYARPVLHFASRRRERHFPNKGLESGVKPSRSEIPFQQTSTFWKRAAEESLGQPQLSCLPSELNTVVYQRIHYIAASSCKERHIDRFQQKFPVGQPLETLILSEQKPSV